MSEEGIYQLYTITKVNGDPVEDFKFVLSPEKDSASRKALEKYAEETDNYALAADIYTWLSYIKK